MSDTKNIVVNALAIVLIATLFVLAFTWIIIDYNGSSESLKDAWDITGSFFGGITTLLAAYIASRLFNDWREVKQYEIILSYIMLIKSNTQDYLNYLNSIRDSYLLDISELKQPHLTLYSYHKILISMSQREREVVSKLGIIMLDVNELYYLKYQNPVDPVSIEFTNKINHFQNLGVGKHNYHAAYKDRLTNSSHQEHYDYLVNDLTTFLYEEILTKYLDELILDKNLK